MAEAVGLAASVIAIIDVSAKSRDTVPPVLHSNTRATSCLGSLLEAASLTLVSGQHALYPSDDQHRLIFAS
jgi:hypothetical protein